MLPSVYYFYKYIFFIFKNDLIEIIINNKEDDVNTLIIIVHGLIFRSLSPSLLSVPRSLREVWQPTTQRKGFVDITCYSLIAAVHNATGQIKGPRGGYERGSPRMAERPRYVEHGGEHQAHEGVCVESSREILPLARPRRIHRRLLTAYILWLLPFVL